MRIFELIDGTLTLLNVPFYNGMPEFAVNEVPDLFVTYSVYDRPQDYGDGIEQVTRYYVTVSIFGTDQAAVDSEYISLLSLFAEYGFIRIGANYTSDDDFPKYYRNTVDFSVDIYN